MPNLSVSSKNTQSPGHSARNKKRADSTFINTFQDLLKIEPDLFEDLVLNDPVSFTPAQTKKGCILKEKYHWINKGWVRGVGGGEGGRSFENWH